MNKRDVPGMFGKAGGIDAEGNWYERDLTPEEISAMNRLLEPSHQPDVTLASHWAIDTIRELIAPNRRQGQWGVSTDPNTSTRA